MYKKIVFGVLLSITVVFPVNAVVVDCGVISFHRMFLSTARSDIYTDHSNKIHLHFGGLGGWSACKSSYDMQMAYIDLSGPASASMITILARMQKQRAESGISVSVRFSIDPDALALSEVNDYGEITSLNRRGEIKERLNFKVVSLDFIDRVE